LYLMLIATTPLTGRALLWVLASSSMNSRQPAAATWAPPGAACWPRPLGRRVF